MRYNFMYLNKNNFKQMTPCQFIEINLIVKKILNLLITYNYTCRKIKYLYTNNFYKI